MWLHTPFGCAHATIGTRQVGSYGCILKRGHIMKRFGLSCICLLYFIRKYTEFYDMRTECQIIIIHLLLLISQKFLGENKRCPIPYLIPDLFSLIYIAIANQLSSWST